MANNQKRVLVLDGGGFRGLGTLLIIDAITKSASSRARTPLRPCDVFDLICGSSIGGLIAILLGRMGLDCPTAIEIYKKLGASLCGNSEPQFVKALLSAESGLESKDFGDELARIVKQYTGHEDSALQGVDIYTHPSTQVGHVTFPR